MADQESTQFSNVFPGASGTPTKVDPIELGGRVRTAVAELNGSELDSNLSDGDLLKLTKLPKNASIVDIHVHSSGVSGMTDEDIGDSNDRDGLMDGLDLSSDGVTKLSDDNGGTNGFDPVNDYAKELWDVLGYSDEKAAPAQIQVEVQSSGATGSGNLTVVFFYTVD